MSEVRVFVLDDDPDHGNWTKLVQREMPIEKIIEEDIKENTDADPDQRNSSDGDRGQDALPSL